MKNDGGPVIVKGGGGGAAVGITLIVVIAILIALFAWHPWSITTTTSGNATTTVQPTGQ